MKYKNILLTGGTGNLGKAIIKSGYFQNILSPNKKILDITKPETIEDFFNKNEIDAVIHCAALARLRECEENPVKSIETNIFGTSNLVNEVIKKDEKTKKKIRFIHISTDGVYEGIKGNYSEKDETIPCNKYGWTKLGAECVVNLLSNFCIIRTRFFDPNNIKFEKSAVDVYTSKITVFELSKAIKVILENNFVGTINIGGKRGSDYGAYKKYKPSIKPCKFEDILKETSFPMTKDASMDISLWEKIEQQYKK
ncbi:MAG: sugar nucleotide-binding protein [Nanoarchaeota archaeon]|nr:sugar nucleotide-binding protein [Nanoarchaeota archaeon]